MSKLRAARARGVRANAREKPRDAATDEATRRRRRYYDENEFTRCVANFMAQTGDPTNTGRGGASAVNDGKGFKDEFHSRLRFNARGRVAMANEGRRDSNGSQWFVTLGECEWLNRRHTIFGKIVGATMYNAIQIGNVETEGDRPIDPAPKILRVEVLANPFPDIEPRRRASEAEAEAEVEDFRKTEEGEEEAGAVVFRRRSGGRRGDLRRSRVEGDKVIARRRRRRHARERRRRGDARGARAHGAREGVGARKEGTRQRALARYGRGRER